MCLSPHRPEDRPEAHHGVKQKEELSPVASTLGTRVPEGDVHLDLASHSLSPAIHSQRGATCIETSCTLFEWDRTAFRNTVR